jgi:hypothetical protein
MLFDYNRLRKEQKDKILGKWKPFLKGIDDGYLRESTAMLLENEAQYLMEDPATQASDVVGIQKILLPIVRRVFPNLVANNLVSVQPLAGPTGVVFYLKYEFVNAKSGGSAGDEYSMYSENPSDTSQGYNAYYSSDEVRMTTSTGTTTTTPLGGQNNAGAGAGTGLDGGGGGQSYILFNTNATYDDGIDSAAYDGTHVTSTAAALLKTAKFRFKIYTTATPTTYSTFLVQWDGRVGKNYWSITETDRGGAGVALNVAYTTLVTSGVDLTLQDWDTTTGRLTNAVVDFDFTGGSLDRQIRLKPFVSNTDFINATYTFLGVEAFYSYKQEATTAIPEMAISISQFPITVKSRKLKATWTNEAEQDLKAYHGLNADAELTALVSNEMIAEIDREIVGKCLDIVPISSHRWVDWNADVANNTSGNYFDRHRNFVQVMVELSNEIYRKSKIGPANWIVTSPKVCSYLEVLEGFVAAPGAVQGGLGIVKAGDFRGSFAVYKDPLFPANKVLMGHKSPASPFGAGLVYAPYVTQVTPTLYGPDDFTPRKGFLARYGLIQVPLGDLLYGMVNVSDLPGST